MSYNHQSITPATFLKPVTAIASGAFLLSPLGIPFFVRGVPRILLAGLGGFLAAEVADKMTENIGQIISQSPEED